MPEVRKAKATWRKLAETLFVLVPRHARRDLDWRLAERLQRHVEKTGVRYLLGFAPMLDEPDLSPFFRRWLAVGGRLAMPVWQGGAGMTLRSVDDLDSQLRPGRGGILEPDANRPEVAERELDLAVTPGRFFSEGCGRMGRGSGCYDALFRRHGLARVGVAYDFQVFPDLPTYEGDVPVDWVITPSRTITRENGGQTNA